MPEPENSAAQQYIHTVILHGPHTGGPSVAHDPEHGILVFGDGVADVDLIAVINTLKSGDYNIGEHTQFLVDTHGTIRYGELYVQLRNSQSTETWAVLQTLAMAGAKDFAVCACFGGAAAGAIESLGEGSTITTFSYPDEVTLSVLCEQNMRKAASTSIVGKEELVLDNPYARFARTILTNPSFYSSFSPKITGGETFKFRSPDFAQFSEAAILQHQRYEFARFVRYCVDLRERKLLPPEHGKYIDNLENSLRADGVMDGPPATKWVDHPPKWAVDLQKAAFSDLVKFSYTRLYQSRAYGTPSQAATIGENLSKNDIYPSGTTALHHACRVGDLDLLTKALHSHPELINQKTPLEGNTALHIAINGHHHKLQRKLIENGADINITNNVNLSPLITALESNNKHAAELLIKSGADVNWSPDVARTPINYAVTKKAPEIVALLRQKGVTVSDYKQSIDDAVWLKSAHLLAALAYDGKGFTEEQQLLFANALQKLVKQRVYLDTNDDSYHSPLYRAIEYDNMWMVQLLEQSGADMRDALSYAVATGNKQAIEYFINKGLDVNAASYSSNRPIEQAVKSGNSEILTILIKNGAVSEDLGWLIDATVARQNPAMLIALAFDGASTFEHKAQFVEALAKLRRFGVDLDAVGADGISPLGHAIANGNNWMAEALQNAGADREAALQQLQNAAVNKGQGISSESMAAIDAVDVRSFQQLKPQRNLDSGANSAEKYAQHLNNRASPVPELPRPAITQGTKLALSTLQPGTGQRKAETPPSSFQATPSASSVIYAAIGLYRGLKSLGGMFKPAPADTQKLSIEESHTQQEALRAMLPLAATAMQQFLAKVSIDGQGKKFLAADNADFTALQERLAEAQAQAQELLGKQQLTPQQLHTVVSELEDIHKTMEDLAYLGTAKCQSAHIKMLNDYIKPINDLLASGHSQETPEAYKQRLTLTQEFKTLAQKGTLSEASIRQFQGSFTAIADNLAPTPTMPNSPISQDASKQDPAPSATIPPSPPTSLSTRSSKTR